MNSVNFKLLTTFIAVAENNSFRLAAKNLHRSESAISTQIKELENQLGVTLFHRTTRIVKITKDGSELLVYAKRAISEWNAGIQHVQRAFDLQSGIVSMACIPTIANSILPNALLAFNKKFPNIAVHVHVLRTAPMLDCLRKNEVDFAVGLKINDDNELQFEHIVDDKIVALGDKSYFNLVEAPIEFEQLCRLPLVTHPRRTAYGALFDGEFQIKSSDLKVKFDTVGIQTMVAFALRGLGVAIVPRSAVPTNLDACIWEVPIIRPAMVRPLGIISFRDKFHAPLVEQLRREVRIALVEATGAISAALA